MFEYDINAGSHDIRRKDSQAYRIIKSYVDALELDARTIAVIANCALN